MDFHVNQDNFFRVSISSQDSQVKAPYSIRSYSKLTYLILDLLCLKEKVIKIKGGETVYYLNKKSVEKWLSKNHIESEDNPNYTKLITQVIESCKNQVKAAKKETEVYSPDLPATNIKYVKTSGLSDSEKTVQRQLLSQWLSQFKNDYAAHAIWHTNVDQVICSGDLKSGEELLRLNSEVEYEKGSGLGLRGISKLPKLNESDVEASHKLSEQDEKRLQDLREKANKIDNKLLKEWRKLEKKISLFKKISDEALIQELDKLTTGSLDDNRKALANVEKQLENHPNKLTPQEKEKLRELRKIVPLTEDELIELKALERQKKYGAYFKVIRAQDEIIIKGSGSDRNAAILDIAEREKVGLREVVTALDISMPKSEGIYAYLAHKYVQWTSKGVKDANNIIVNMMDRFFGVSKLNYNIRVLKNAIAWGYGDVVVLKGNAKAISSPTSKFDTDGTENTLPNPWQNEGDFFRLPLNQEDVIVIGPEKELMKHKKEMDEKGIKYVFVESMDQEQLNFLKVPKYLSS